MPYVKNLATAKPIILDTIPLYMLLKSVYYLLRKGRNTLFMIEIDSSITYQIIAFFVLLFALNRFLYKPVFAMMEERKRLTEGTVQSASSTEDEVRQGLVEYEKRLKEAAKAAQEESGVLRDKALMKEAEIMEAAREEAQEELQKMRGEIAAGKVLPLKTLSKRQRVFPSP